MKERLYILDGLRGVAALSVLLYHLFEAVAFASGAPEQNFFHGFLAVDFFFVLSGFVMGYAYDGRWDEMNFKSFAKRRLIRLHPMVVMGVFIGLVVFLCQGSLDWNGEKAGWTNILFSTLLALLLLPSPLSMDLRGNTEMFPLNGPHWSLFFEYIGNILYALVLRRLSTKGLRVWVVLAAVCLISFGILGPYDNLGYGWSSKPSIALGGFLRMNFAYPMGLLLARMATDRKKETKSCFLPLAVLLCLLLSVPSLGKFKLAYELFTVIAAFPLIIWFGSGIQGRASEKIASFFGEISYPLYAIHYPFIYLYIGWINAGKYPFGTVGTPIIIAMICITLAIFLSRCYDLPVRRELSKLFKH